MQCHYMSGEGHNRAGQMSTTLFCTVVMNLQSCTFLSGSLEKLATHLYFVQRHHYDYKSHSNKVPCKRIGNKSNQQIKPQDTRYWTQEKRTHAHVHARAHTHSRRNETDRDKIEKEGTQKASSDALHCDNNGRNQIEKQRIVRTVKQ